MLVPIIVMVFLARIILMILGNVDLPAWKFTYRRKMKYVEGLFVNNFIDAKVLFVTRFKGLPSISVITQIDVTKAYAFITEKLNDQITNISQANIFDHNEGKTFFQVTIIELKNKRIIELGPAYVEVLHTASYFEWARVLLADLATFRIEANILEEKAPTVVGFARAMEMN